MNKKKIIGISLFAIFALVALKSVVMAYPHPSDEEENLPFYRDMRQAFIQHHAPFEMMQTIIKLNITDEQKTEIADILKSNRPVINSIHSSARMAAINLVKEVSSESIDEQAIRSATQQLASYIEDGIVVKAQVLNQIKSILTDEQKEILLRKREKFLETIQKSKENHPHRQIKETLDLWIDTHSSR